MVVKYEGDLLPERRGIIGALFNSVRRTDRSLRVVRRGRRFARFTKPSYLIWVLLLVAFFLISLSVFGLRLHLPGNLENLNSVVSSSTRLDVADKGESTRRSISSSNGANKKFSVYNNLTKAPKIKQRKRHSPCEVKFVDSVDYLRELKDIRNFTQFSLQYVVLEEKPLGSNFFLPRFGGHQTLQEREKSFYARNQTVHCGFVKGPAGFPSTGFDLDEKDRVYMNTCQISEFSKRIVCFVMFVDEQTQSKLLSDGNIPDDRGYVGLWRIVVVRNLPYEDMRRTGKVPKFLSHRLFPSASYSIWLDSKMRLTTDPLLIIERFLWQTQSEYAISNHYDRHCVWEEVLQNKRLNKYNHTAIDDQFNFYLSDGLRKFDPSDPNTPLPSYVPEGSFIIRAHSSMSNLFSCLWFNEVDRFTSRDQLSFAYTYLKLRRFSPDQPLYLNMFKDCERRALAKLFRHRTLITPPGP